MKDERVYHMKFSEVYPLLVNKAQRKGRTKQEVNQIISWLTGYALEDIAVLAESDEEYGTFFQNAPALNPNRRKITGSVCGVCVERMEDSLMKEIRYLDKLVDELARGKSMEKILRA